MNRLWQSFIILFSEAIWIYYGIGMFASVEMGQATFLFPLWWGIAGIAGYGLNIILSRRANIPLLIIGNVIVLSIILVQNWQVSYIDGRWLLALVLSAGVSFVYIRSASFIYRSITRKIVLQRFEGNIIFYALFALVLIPNGWGNESFHIVFLLAIVCSLVGMILSLQQGQEEKVNGVKVLKVGQAGWFTVIMSTLLIGVAFISSLLFLPGIRAALYTAGMGGLSLLKSVVQLVFRFISWFLSLFPSSKEEGVFPELEPAEQINLGEMEEEIAFSFPVEWVIGCIIMIALLSAIWLLVKFLRKWQPPKRQVEQLMTVTRESWWLLLWKKSSAWLKDLKKKWRSRFSHYYKEPVYWYYKQVQNWGRQNGLPRSASETTKEYIEKIAAVLMRTEKELKVDVLHIVALLRQLNDDFQATYYGFSNSVELDKYRQLLTFLKQINVKKIARK